MESRADKLGNQVGKHELTRAGDVICSCPGWEEEEEKRSVCPLIKSSLIQFVTNTVPEKDEWCVFLYVYCLTVTKNNKNEEEEDMRVVDFFFTMKKVRMWELFRRSQQLQKETVWFWWSRCWRMKKIRDKL